MNTHRYTFRGYNGYIINPHDTQVPHNLLALGHTAGIEPWRDPVLHVHAASDEMYCLLQGELYFLVDEVQINLRAFEILLVRAGSAHAVLGGLGAIEHIGLRTPALEDKSHCGDIPVDLTRPIAGPRDVFSHWGARLSLDKPEHQNTWLIGSGSATVASAHISLAYLNFPTHESANAGIGSRHRLHFHEHSWEYYLVLQGEKTLQIGDEQVTIVAGELLEVPPGLPHTLASRQAPYSGFTLRVPAVLDDKVEVA